MRLPRFRFTVRRMMVAVAIVGLLLAVALWASRMIGRARDYRAQASAHAILEAELRSWVMEWEDVARSAEGERMKGVLGRKADHSRRMSIKYGRAARYPWLPVSPDPPEPE